MRVIETVLVLITTYSQTELLLYIFFHTFYCLDQIFSLLLRYTLYISPKVFIPQFYTTPA